MTWIFWVLAALMAAVALLLALPVFIRPRRSHDDAAMIRRENIAAARARLAALPADGVAGEYEAEIKSRLLSETEDINPTAVGGGDNRADWAGAAVVAAVLLPGALALYLWLGAPAAVTAASPPPLAVAVKNLRRYTEANPQDAAALALMGRSLATLGRAAEAATFFARARAAGDDTLPLLLAHAGTLLAVGENAEFDVLLQEALLRAPDSPRVLWLAGLAAQRDGNMQAAAVYWQRVQALSAGDAQGQIADSLAASTTVDSGVVAVITVADALRGRFQPGDVLFVFVRPAGVADGPPLAVKKLTAGALPLTVRLDDRAAMTPAAVMSGFSEFDIAARIAKGGSAARRAGDLSGAATAVPTGATVTVRINSVLGG